VILVINKHLSHHLGNRYSSVVSPPVSHGARTSDCESPTYHLTLYPMYLKEPEVAGSWSHLICFVDINSRTAKKLGTPTKGGAEGAIVSEDSTSRVMVLPVFSAASPPCGDFQCTWCSTAAMYRVCSTGLRETWGSLELSFI